MSWGWDFIVAARVDYRSYVVFKFLFPEGENTSYTKPLEKKEKKIPTQHI